MTAVEILAAALADGVAVTAGPDGLRAAGPRDACARWVPILKEHRGELLELLTQPRRLWLVREASGKVWSVSCCPPATWKQMQARYPGAEITPEVEHPIRPSPAPSDADLVKIRGWLARIGEADRELVAETLDRCRADAEAFSYFMALAMEPIEDLERSR